MKRGTIIVILFLIIAAAIVGASQFLQNQPPITVTIAVDDLGSDWLRAAVEDFNASDTRINGTRRVEVVLSTVNDLDVWGPSGTVNWNAQDHPDGWIPSSSVALEYSSLPFETLQPSLARTPMLIGGYTSRVNVLTNDGFDLFGWGQIFNAAEVQSWEALGGQSNWGFVNLAFSLPDRKMCGLATLYTAAAYASDDPNLTGDAIRGDFRDQFESVIDSVPNFNSIGNDVASFVARGPATADIGIGPESLWLKNLSGLSSNEAVTFAYPRYNFVFDFPLAVWRDNLTAEDNISAVEAFGAWLASSAQQARVTEFGLRPVKGTPTATDTLFADALPFGVQLDPPIDTALIQHPLFNDTQGLLAWFQQTRN